MTKRKSQLNPKVKRMFTGTEVGALLEDVDQKLGIIIEGQAGWTRRADRIETRLDTVIDAVADIKVEFSEVNDKLDRKADHAHVKQLEHRVSVLEAK